MDPPLIPDHDSGTTLVTGATGLVGNNVVRLLLEKKQRVRVLVRRAGKAPELAGLDVESITGDIRDEAAVRQACHDVAAVIHCAAYVRIGWSQRETFVAINVDGTRNVARACREQGIRLVHVSSTDVFGRCSLRAPTNEDSPFAKSPGVPYVETKRQAEAVVAAEIGQGLDAVIVNPAFMLGPWDWKPSSGQLLLSVAANRAILAPRGWLSLCDVRDVAMGILAALERGKPGRRYILAGQTMEWIELLRLMAGVTGGRRPVARGRPAMLKIGGWGGDLWGRITGEEPSINSAAVAMAWLPKNYSSARAAAELDYSNRPVIQTLRDAWIWFQTHEGFFISRQ
jgi:dihydroflavonol-4-reductase